jgi:hypothetical protein
MSKDKNLDSAQNNQKIEEAESNLEIVDPAENLGEESTEMTDESQESEEPA